MSTVPLVNVDGAQSANGNTGFISGVYGTGVSDMWRTAPLIAAYCDINAFHQFVDDFYDVADTTPTDLSRYATVADGAGALTQLDAAGGVAVITSGATDNDEIYISSMSESFLFAASKPLWFEAKIIPVEVATNKLNLIIGLSDTVGANTLQDNGAGPAASYDGAVFFKVDGGTTWSFESSNAGTQVTTNSLGTATSGTAVRLGFIFDPNDGTTGKITPYINGVAGTTQDITLSGLEEMHILFGIKAGSAAAETSKVDYIRVLAVR